MACDISASGSGPYPDQSRGQMCLTFSLNSFLPAHLHGVGEDADGTAKQMRAYLGTVGQPIKTTAWKVPAAFFALLLAVLAPVIVLFVQGQLSLWLIPLVALITWTFGSVSKPVLQQRVRDERIKRIPWDIDLRPMEQVRLDKEQGRQRRQTGVRYAVISGLTVAVVAAVLTAVLRQWLP
ncbi:hypothetical protein LY71_113126 [Geodermatophilus tzadiensis]|uniref:Uncharacterized protein n=1 Tax=Geodermatophilus tzadiensis TaxID=1137988 RepID=A0A2T0TPH1_9ACTN|nr:hypothetical protein LY71_113126 [Geodermatophilus tzadiensis]